MEPRVKLWERPPGREFSPLMPMDQYHSNSLRRGRHSKVGLYYALTKCCQGRTPFLARCVNGQVMAEIVVDCIREMESRAIWSCSGFVVMPDHLHLAVKLLSGDLSAAMKSFSSFTGSRINAELQRKGPFWQTGYHEHAIRGEKSLAAFLEYIAMNPVRAGLIEDFRQWPYSSFRTDSGSSLGQNFRRQEAAPTTTDGVEP